MKITYVYHSCYVIEQDNISLIFDFYKDQNNLLNKLLANSNKNYFFASHSHFDHYNKDIFKYRENSEYILSYDIPSVKEKVNILSKGQKYKDSNIYVAAYGSTDEGISFYVEFKGKKIFHAGDLNNWHWNEESSEEESKEYEEFYERELNNINIDYLDLCLYPLDPRLGKDFSKGATQFLNKIKVENFAPMHFEENFDILKSFKDKLKDTNYLLPEKSGDSFCI